MIDIRYQKWARTLVHYSLALKPGDKFLLTGGVHAEPLIREVYREAIRAGAEVHVRVNLDSFNEIFYQEASEAQVKHLPELAMYEINYLDAMLNIRADVNTRAMSATDPKRMAQMATARSPWTARYLERAAQGDLRWCVTMFPTNAYAQDASMSYDQFETFVLNGCLLDVEDPVAAWVNMSTDQQRWIDYLSKHDEIHIVAGETSIKYRVAGRTWINADGKRNFPDGEIFTAPIEDSVNGVVVYTYPAVYGGKEADHVRLVFKEGKVVESSAQRGEDFLTEMLNMDAGARYLGEVAFGTNYHIRDFIKQVLFDEKIGGTMHMALGKAYPDSGGKNVSALHWDMVCDLRQGKVYADGELFYENGKFLI